MPSLARSVRKPLKVSSLARSVPKPLSILAIDRRKTDASQPFLARIMLVFAYKYRVCLKY